MDNDNMDNFEDRTIIAPTTPHNRGYEQANFQQSSPSFEGKIEYLKGLSVLFKDPNVKNNLLIGFVFVIIPIVGNIAIMGWFCEIIQRMLRKHPNPIPKLQFSDFGHYLGRGVMPFLVSLVVGIVLGVVASIFLFIGILISSLLGAIHPIIGLISILLVYLLFYILIIALNAFVGIPISFAEVSEDFSKAIDFKKIMAVLKLTWSKCLVGALIIALVSIPIALAGALLCGIGFYLSTFIIMFTLFYFRAQIYQFYLAQGGEPVEMKAPQVLPSEQNMAQA